MASLTRFGGQFENQPRAAKRLAMVVPLGLSLIFLILFSAFRCLRQAGLILRNIPFAVVGSVAALFVGGLITSTLITLIVLPPSTRGLKNSRTPRIAPYETAHPLYARRC